MIKNEFKNETVITADKGNYLRLKDKKDSEKLIGKPERIIFNNSDIIPEFEEKLINE